MLDMLLLSVFILGFRFSKFNVHVFGTDSLNWGWNLEKRESRSFQLVGRAWSAHKELHLGNLQSEFLFTPTFNGGHAFILS
jgi:hypothetical protein